MTTARVHGLAWFPLLVLAVGWLPFAVVAARHWSGTAAAAVDSTTRGLEPLPAAVLPALPRMPPPGLPGGSIDGADPDLRLVSVVSTDRWEEARALIWHAGAVRAYAIGDLVPGGAAVVAIHPAAVDLAHVDHQVYRLSRQTYAVIEDFPLAVRPRARRLPPPAPGLREAVEETLAMARGPDAGSAQVAVDALVEAGEPVVRFLAEKAGSLVALPGWTVRLPGGQEAAPTLEGALAQAILEGITGQRFGDVLAPDVLPSEVVASAEDWASWLGLP